VADQTASMSFLIKTRTIKLMGKTIKLAKILINQLPNPIFMLGIAPRAISSGAMIVFRMIVI
jgi:hypothetical protein